MICGRRLRNRKNLKLVNNDMMLFAVKRHLVETRHTAYSYNDLYAKGF